MRIPMQISSFDFGRGKELHGRNRDMGVKVLDCGQVFGIANSLPVKSILAGAKNERRE